MESDDVEMICPPIKSYPGVTWKSQENSHCRNRVRNLSPELVHKLVELLESITA